jgi:hypothetical protein
VQLGGQPILCRPAQGGTWFGRRIGFPIVATSGLLLSLTNMQGLGRADLDRKRVVVRAGTKVGDIGRPLKEIGLSLAN